MPGCTSIAVIVKGNRKVGHFSVSFVDMELPLAGLPIRLTRTYDSRDKRVGDFGFLLGIFLLFWTLAGEGQGTLVFRELAARAHLL